MNITPHSTGSFVDQLNWHTNQSTKALERLASGSRLLAPQDDAAGLAVATRTESKLRQLNAAANNIANATSFSQTQSGYLEGVQAVLNRMGSLTIRAQDATLSSEQRMLFQEEFRTLKDTFNDLRTAQYNGKNLFDGERIPVATSPDETVVQVGGIDLFSDQMNKVTARDTHLESFSDAKSALSSITQAIDQISQHRAQVGSTLSELESSSERLSTERSETEAAFSRIADSDIAAETSNWVREKILTQNSVLALQKANGENAHLIDLLS